MLIPLNNIIADIATINKEVKINDFCASLLLFAINIQTSLNIINKPNPYRFDVLTALRLLVVCPSNVKQYPTERSWIMD
jgi:hypothetical protein